MAEQTSASIVIEAPAQQVMETIAAVEDYPTWVGAVTSVEVLERGAGDRARSARFVMDAGPVKDTYVLDYDWAADGLSVSWVLTEGQIQKAQAGSYRLRETADGTEVTYELTVDLTIPMIGMLKRKAEKVIINTALGELKKRVEG